MPRAKKIKKVNKDDDGFLRLKREHLLEIELLRSKAQERKLLAQKLHLEAEKISVNSALTIRALRNDALVAEKEERELKEEQASLFKRLNNVYGVDFKKATYDDETGVITVLEEKSKNDKLNGASFKDSKKKEN